MKTRLSGSKSSLFQKKASMNDHNPWRGDRYPHRLPPPGKGSLHHEIPCRRLAILIRCPGKLQKGMFLDQFNYSAFLCFARVLAELDFLKNNIIKLHNYPAKAIAIQPKY